MLLHFHKDMWRIRMYTGTLVMLFQPATWRCFPKTWCIISDIVKLSHWHS